jgi:hypothetical protein
MMACCSSQSALKKRLEALHYTQPLEASSAVLVERLLNDLVKTTEELYKLKRQVDKGSIKVQEGLLQSESTCGVCGVDSGVATNEAFDSRDNQWRMIVKKLKSEVQNYQLSLEQSRADNTRLDQENTELRQELEDIVGKSSIPTSSKQLSFEFSLRPSKEQTGFSMRDNADWTNELRKADDKVRRLQDEFRVAHRGRQISLEESSCFQDLAGTRDTPQVLGDWMDNSWKRKPTVLAKPLIFTVEKVMLRHHWPHIITALTASRRLLNTLEVNRPLTRSQYRNMQDSRSLKNPQNLMALTEKLALLQGTGETLDTTRLHKAHSKSEQLENKENCDFAVSRTLVVKLLVKTLGAAETRCNLDLCSMSFEELRCPYRDVLVKRPLVMLLTVMRRMSGLELATAFKQWEVRCRVDQCVSMVRCQFNKIGLLAQIPKDCCDIEVISKTIEDNLCADRKILAASLLSSLFERVFLKRLSVPFNYLRTSPVNTDLAVMLLVRTKIVLTDAFSIWHYKAGCLHTLSQFKIKCSKAVSSLKHSIFAMSQGRALDKLLVIHRLTEAKQMARGLHSWREQVLFFRRTKKKAVREPRGVSRQLLKRTPSLSPNESFHYFE